MRLYSLARLSVMERSPPEQLRRRRHSKRTGNDSDAPLVSTSEQRDRGDSRVDRHRYVDAEGNSKDGEERDVQHSAATVADVDTAANDALAAAEEHDSDATADDDYTDETASEDDSDQDRRAEFYPKNGDYSLADGPYSTTDVDLFPVFLSGLAGLFVTFVVAMVISRYGVDRSMVMASGLVTLLGMALYLSFFKQPSRQLLDGEGEEDIPLTVVFILGASLGLLFGTFF